MVMLYEQPSAFGGQGEPTTLAALQDESALVLLGPNGEFLYSRGVRWVEIDLNGMDPNWVDDEAALDRAEQDLTNTIAWVSNLPESPDRTDFLEVLNGMLHEVPYAREMLGEEAREGHELVPEVA